VAVKARVGKKIGVTPKPGMKEISSDLPKDAEFSGAVQAMGFRFKVDELVVPMRLASYNPGKLFNVVYVLTDEPTRIEQLSEEFVKEQISGSELYKNLTDLLPVNVRYYQGKAWKTSMFWRGKSPRLSEEVWNENQWKMMGTDKDFSKERNPAPHNGKALALFASDLLSAAEGRLEHRFEQHHKELLNVNEELGLRGPHIDELVREEMAAERKRAFGDVLKDLEGMTLTRLEGDFPREIIRQNDLTFVAYKKGAANGSGSKKGSMTGDPTSMVLFMAGLGLLVLVTRYRTQSVK